MPAVAPAKLVLKGLFPSKGDAAACTDAPLRLTFDAPPRLGKSGAVHLLRAADRVQVATIDVATTTETRLIGDRRLRVPKALLRGNQATLPLPGKTLRLGLSYVVTVDPGVFVDAQGKPFGGVGQKDGWRFTVKASPPLADIRPLRVAADGSADFCTVQGAIDAIATSNTRARRIEVAPGFYEELVVLAGKNNVTLHGAGRERATLAFRNNDKINPGRNARFSAGFFGDDLTLEGLTFWNRTPKGGSQAEALRITGQRCRVIDCDARSFQDTLSIDGRVYFARCRVAGDVDYVWGYGTAFFDHCAFETLNRGYLVQARNDAAHDGYVFADCTLTARPGVKDVALARIEPARFPGSQVAFIRCAMGDFVSPAGWIFDPAKGAPKKPVDPAGIAKTIRFWEFESKDAGGRPMDVSKRCPGSRQLSAAEAARVGDPRVVLGGKDGWNPLADDRQ
jgi:hypothetical protein